MTEETQISDMSEADIAALYNTGFADMKSRVRVRQPYLPKIMLTVFKTEKKDKKGVKIGDWYLLPGSTPQGEEPKYENLGPKVEFTVLSDSMQLSFYSDADKRSLVESSEFQNYSGDPIFLLDSRRGPMHVAAVVPYSGNAPHTLAKLRKDAAWPQKVSKSGETVSALDFDYNVYVMLPDGRVCLLCNTKRGHFGTDNKTGETCEFGNIAPDSFLRARATCHDKTPGLTLAHRWRVSSVKVSEDIDDIRPAFEILGFQDPKRKEDIREAADWLQHHLQEKWADRIGYAWRNTSPADRDRLVTSYAGIRPMLDEFTGHDAAARIILGKQAAPALLTEPEPNYTEMQARLGQEEASKIDELKREEEERSAFPREVIDVTPKKTFDIPDIGYESNVKVEDLPF